MQIREVCSVNDDPYSEVDEEDEEDRGKEEEDP